MQLRQLQILQPIARPSEHLCTLERLYQRIFFYLFDVKLTTDSDCGV
jgi:hypothetical protein